MRILFFCCGFLFSGFALASGIEQMRVFWADTQAASGTFSQSVVSKSGRRAQNSSGSFILARPGLLRWSYETPYRLLLVADGTRLWTFDADLKQVTVGKLGQALGGTPAALLTGDALDQHFTLVEVGTVDGLEVVDAIPKGTGSSFVRVRIGLSGNLPRLMEVEDHFGQRTTLLFTRIEANPRLPRDAFRFVPPPGADVIGK